MTGGSEMSDKVKKAALSEEKATKKEKRRMPQTPENPKRKRKKVRFQENCRLV